MKGLINMDHNKQPQILQIIPVFKPLVAVFEIDNAPDEICTDEVCAIELVKDGYGNVYERGVFVSENFFENVEAMSGFLGYARDEKQAEKIYHKKIAPKTIYTKNDDAENGNDPSGNVRELRP
jgi:hypothetical protein